MDSLYELAEDLESGDYLAWQAENGTSVDETYPKTVQTVRKQRGVIRVEADGRGGGEYHFTVAEADVSESYFHPSPDESEPMGALFFAERTDSLSPVTVKCGWYDST